MTLKECGEPGLARSLRGLLGMERPLLHSVQTFSVRTYGRIATSDASIIWTILEDGIDRTFQYNEFLELLVSLI